MSDPQDYDNYDDKSPEAIERDIARTRERISEDIDAISYQLSPQRFRERAEESLYSAQEAVMSTLHEVTDSVTDKVKETSSSVFDTIKDNPLPAALIGLGIGLLAAGSATAANSASHASGSHQSGGQPDRSAGAPGSSLYSGSYGGAYGGTYGGSSGNSFGSYGSRSSGLTRWVEEQPLAVGIIAALVGAAVGLGIPGTRYEDRMLGDVGGELRERAKHAVHDVTDTVKDSARDLRDQAKQQLDRGMAAAQEAGREMKVAAQEAGREMKAAAQDFGHEAKAVSKDMEHELKSASKDVSDAAHDSAQQLKNEMDNKG